MRVGCVVGKSGARAKQGAQRPVRIRRQSRARRTGRTAVLLRKRSTHPRQCCATQCTRQSSPAPSA